MRENISYKNICNNSRFQISSHDLTKIDLVVKEIGKLLPQINGNRKRMISIIFTLRQLFKMLNLLHENIPITKSKRH